MLLLLGCAYKGKNKMAERLDDGISMPTSLAGKHGFTLQWIGWEDWGEVQFDSIAEKTYAIRGQQIGKPKGSCPECEASIEGTVQVVSRDTLLFTGIIVSTISHINNGLPCKLEGSHFFVSSESKNYWRCQEKQVCDGVTNYFDIYF